ncbi:MAG: DUF402 domain-containing protein [Actinomycetales bacterium]
MPDPDGVSTPVRIVTSKWGNRPHYEFDAVLLGHDEHGSWLGLPRGTRVTRPGVDFRTAHLWVALVPDGAPYLASFYERGATTAVYVDMTTPPQWVESGAGRSVRMVDLDLDVVREQSGRVFIDDEDEFADHQVRFGYPQEVIEMARHCADEVYAAVLAERAPFSHATGLAWVERLAALSV